MEKKNMIMTLIILLVTILTFSVGTYAYFSMNFKDERTTDNGSTLIKTCKLAEATIVSDIPNTLGGFVSTDIYPGHKEVISMSISAKGDLGSTSNFEFVYHVTENNLGDNIKVSLYKSNEKINTSNNYFDCEKMSEKIDNESIFFEKCSDKPLGELLNETNLHGGVEEISIGNDILVVKNVEQVAYYYIVVEFLNKNESQNTVMNKVLNGKITVRPTTRKRGYKESLLNGTDPVLKDELIPVVIESDGTVKKADLSDNWYNYKNQEWANAVILKDKNDIYCPYEVIPEEAIESYFVWIPKYRYQLWDLGNYNSSTSVDSSKIHSIPIIFGDYNTNDSVNGECTTPMKSGASEGCQIGDYMTHPAFISIPSTGFWVGKFETSYKESTTKLSAEVNKVEPSSVQIKPNKFSWRNIQVANAFYTSYNYKRNLDSHMMKNTEWGAVAYLQHSNYGTHASVRINNHSDYKTGYASANEPTCGFTGDNRDCNKYGTTSDITHPYNTATGYLASTTGNITGIYDMAGGSWEYVMGVMSNQAGNPLSGRNENNNSGFIGPYENGGTLSVGLNFPDSRYYDKYKYEVDYLNKKQRILGDATGENGPFGASPAFNGISRMINSWYSDYNHFVITTHPYVYRGGSSTDGIFAGIFAAGHDPGYNQDNASFRLILTPKI